MMHLSSLMLMKNIIFKLFILRILLGEHQISLSEMDYISLYTVTVERVEFTVISP